MDLKFRVLDKNSEDPLEKLTAQSFPGLFKVGCANVGGEKIVMLECYYDFLNKIQDMEIRDDDIWLMGYQKTGTTWAKEIIWIISHEFDEEKSKGNMAKIFPTLEMECLANLQQADEAKINAAKHVYKSYECVTEMKSPRFIKSHIPWDVLPKQLREGTVKPKIIYISRNPKDTYISYYNYSKKLNLFTGSFEEFCTLVINDHFYLSFWKNIFDYWNQRNEPNILFIRFEEMKSDLPEVIRKIATFLNKPYTEEQVKKLAESMTFDTMKSNKKMEFKDHPVYKAFDGNFMRAGEVGNYKKIMTEEIIEKFDKWTRENLNGTDLPLEYFL